MFLIIKRTKIVFVFHLLDVNLALKSLVACQVIGATLTAAWFRLYLETVKLIIFTRTTRDISTQKIPAFSKDQAKKEIQELIYLNFVYLTHVIIINYTIAVG